MTEPTKFILHPWRRGDGSLCKEPGVYAMRTFGEKWNGWYFFRALNCHQMVPSIEYAGPIEFVETEPEPEPIVPSGYYLRRHAGPIGSALPLELCRESDGQLILSVYGLTRRSSVEVFNAAVRTLDGKDGN